MCVERDVWWCSAGYLGDVVQYTHIFKSSIEISGSILRSSLFNAPPFSCFINQPMARKSLVEAVCSIFTSRLVYTAADDTRTKKE